MRAAVVATALGFLVGCASPGSQIRKRAALDFGCPEDEIIVREFPSSCLARGCRKQAEYLLQERRVTRTSEITKATSTSDRRSRSIAVRRADVRCMTDLSAWKALLGAE